METDEDVARRDRMWGVGNWMVCIRCPANREFHWIIHSRAFHKTYPAPGGEG